MRIHPFGLTTLILAGCLTLAAPAHAIVNVLPLVSSKDAKGFLGRLEASLKVNYGNSNLIQTSGKAQLGYRLDKHLFLAVGSANYGLGGSLNENTEVVWEDSPIIWNTFEHLRYRYHWRDWLAFEGFVQHQYDKNKRLELRALVGGGTRFRVDLGDSAEMALGTTLMFEHEVEDTGDSGATIDTSLLRASCYIRVLSTLNDHVSWQGTVFVQPRLDRLGTDDPLDLRVLAEAALISKLAEAFSLKTSLNWSYDSLPPETVRTSDLTTSVALVYSF